MKRVAHAHVLRALPAAIRPTVDALLAEARRRHLEVHLVGGPVRDFLLDRPLRDVDLVVTPDPGREPSLAAAELAREVAPADARITEHERFGTASVRLAGGVLDVASARRETYARPGALPKVEPGSLEEDLARRDFSVNALAIRLAGKELGEKVAVVDPGEGLRDLADKQLRVLHPQSFHDDPTRALRAARLAPRLGFALTRGSRSALRDALRDGVFGAVSGERLRREFEKLFADGALGLNPVESLRRLDGWHVLAALEPGPGHAARGRAGAAAIGSCGGRAAVAGSALAAVGGGAGRLAGAVAARTAPPHAATLLGAGPAGESCRGLPALARLAPGRPGEGARPRRRRRRRPRLRRGSTPRAVRLGADPDPPAAPALGGRGPGPPAAGHGDGPGGDRAVGSRGGPRAGAHPFRPSGRRVGQPRGGAGAGARDRATGAPPRLTAPPGRGRCPPTVDHP